MPDNVTTPLERVKVQIEKLAAKPFNKKYSVPGLWSFYNSKSVNQKIHNVHPGEFFLSHINAIEKAADVKIDPCKSINMQIAGSDHGNWIHKSYIYNFFVRYTAAFDHDSDGTIGGHDSDNTLNSEGIRESGTFLKAISMLGYLKKLGVSAIHLLPVTAIGKDGNKGNAGSPYAIKDPYKLEPTLADPLLEMSVDDQFCAFIQACHMMGIRVIAEFVFRTASKDSDWIATNPEWFYWIKEEIQDRVHGLKDPVEAAGQYGNPVFDNEVLALINHKINTGDFDDLPVPPEKYKDFFTSIPEIDAVKLNSKGQYRAKVKNQVTGEETTGRIPGAFADWPPDDNQPPWNDVTYLRMYKDQNPDSPEFNYISYNTIRMYDNKYAQAELANKELWDAIVGLVPYYQKKFGIDGVMVDMGHAVPVSLMQSIVHTARENDPNFAFLSENFEMKQDSVDSGYNAVLGYCWWVAYDRDGLYNLFNHVGNEGVPIHYLGAIENHNTPRAASRESKEKYSRWAFLVNSFLPRAIPFVHSGQEFGETNPVNTGLDFKKEDMEQLKDKKLPLFDLCSLNWNKPDVSLIEFYSKVISLRKEFDDIASDISTQSFCMVQTGEPDVVAFIRRKDDRHLLIVFNRNPETTFNAQITLGWCLPPGLKRLENLLYAYSGSRYYELEEKRIVSNFKPGECCLFSW